ncbi:MAG: hypothetical protein F2817_19325 [Actinobacteria bacterium]|nr:hypothetical protein [Actinomycetota bacterium]
MICPKCSADTRVIDSRPHQDDTRVFQRRRVCTGCGHRFPTWESTIDVAAQRARQRQAQATYKTRMDPAVRAARIARSNLRRDAKVEAAETGRPLEDVLRAWDIKPAARAKPASRPRRRPTPRCNEGSATTPNLERTR